MNQASSISSTEKGVSNFVRAQMGLHGETGFSLAKKIGKSYTYTRERVEGIRAWTVADLETLSHLWSIPIVDFFSTTMQLKQSTDND